MIDREELFQLLADKKWDDISKILLQNSESIITDPVFNYAIDLFENEFFLNIDSLSARDKLKSLEYPGIVVELNKKSFTNSFVEQLLDLKLELLHSLNSDKLLSFANNHQERPLARKYMSEIMSNEPETIADARRQNTSIKSTDTEPSQTFTINLFKSIQEENFFEAVRKAFPTYHPYPNVAVSCILDFDAIKHKLSTKQKDYFFRSIIDCVVFDASDRYRPLYFVELDSNYHDNDNAKTNDSMKDAIFLAANVKLIRIRGHETQSTTVNSFHKLVLEVMRDL